MFCRNCGKQLEDGAKFCIYCGNPTEAPAPVQTEPPQVSAPVETAPPQIPLDPQIDLYPDPAPAPEYPAGGPANMPYDVNVYTDPKPPVVQKKKGGKKGLIIAIIVVLVLLIAGGVGVYLYTQHVYEENMAAYEAAELLLEKGDYDGALKGFQALEDFEDAADRAEELEELQEAYDEAIQMLLDKDFYGARNAFFALGDYRDSKNYVENEITYLEATDQMNLAQGAPDTGMALSYYATAAEIFETLGDYSDAAEMASACWLEYALIQLNSGDYEEALACQEHMNAADIDSLQNAYAEVCADGAFLKDLKAAMITWYDENDQYTFADELSRAWDMVQPYSDDYFADETLPEQLENFLYALQLMYSSLDTDDSIGNWSDYYLGASWLFSVAEELYDSHGLFADDPENVDTFVGRSEIFYAYSVLESSFTSWWDNASADQMDDGHYYAAYTNDTGYSFNLYATIYFYDYSGNLVEVGEEITIYVAKGATVYIPVIPATISDSQWETWGMYWDFGDVS